MNKIKPFDIIIFVSILVFSAFLIKNSFSVKNKNTVTVNADGKIYKYSLEKDGIYTVSGAIGKTTFQIQNKKVKIIIVTSMPECSYVERAKKIGVEGFWYKDFSPEPILTIIERVLSGESVYPDDMPEIQLGLAKSGELTARELEILREMTGGFTNAEIAEKLGISEKRVRNHVANMLEKTGFRSRTELAVRAREAGIVILDRTEDDI